MATKHKMMLCCVTVLRLMSCRASSSVSKGVRRVNLTKRSRHNRAKYSTRGAFPSHEEVVTVLLKYRECVVTHSRSRRAQGSQPDAMRQRTAHAECERTEGPQHPAGREPLLRQSEASRGIRRQELRARSRSSALAKSLSLPCPPMPLCGAHVRRIGIRPRS